MKRITKYCDSIRKAERKQNSLYNQYNYVRLVSSPFLTEKGQYVWEVS